MRRHGRSVTPVVGRGPGRRTVILRINGDRYSMTLTEALDLADQLVDAAEHAQETAQ